MKFLNITNHVIVQNMYQLRRQTGEIDKMRTNYIKK